MGRSAEDKQGCNELPVLRRFTGISLPETLAQTFIPKPTSLNKEYLVYFTRDTKNQQQEESGETLVCQHLSETLK